MSIPQWQILHKRRVISELFTMTTGLKNGIWSFVGRIIEYNDNLYLIGNARVDERRILKVVNESCNYG